jgi:uncharacterized protein YpmS
MIQFSCKLNEKGEHVMKAGWKWLMAIVLLLSLVEWLIIGVLWFQVRELQVSRNKQWNYTQAHERQWVKQGTLNREVLYKMNHNKRAERDWPLHAQKERTQE